MPYFVYIARCADGSLYTGTCRDLKKRESTHNAGKGAKYTRGRRPVVFVYHTQCTTLGDALRMERKWKSLKRSEKENLILRPQERESRT